MTADPPHERPPPAGQGAERVAAIHALIPTLRTERLTLRAPRITDFDAYAQIALSERGRFLLEEQTREAAWFDFAAMTAGWALRGHGLWSVETKAAGALIGFVLIGLEPGDQEPELGYLLGSDAEGRGFATEAAQAALTFAAVQLRLPSLVSYVDPENARSARVAERLGGRRDHGAEAALNGAALVFRYMPRRAD